MASLIGGLGWRLNLILLLLTFATTTLFGAFFFFISADSLTGLFQELSAHLTVEPLAFLARGLPYSVPVLLILGSHEMGHYCFCRWYGVRATLPYFLPSVIPFPFGTFGAVIRMRPPVPSRRALFDIGVSGPIAGFLVALPVIAYGLATAKVTPIVDTATGGFGEPLAILLIHRLVRGPFPDGLSLAMNPPLLAGWLGLLVTAMNLFPVGQLDGGHVAYALSPRLHRVLSRLTVMGMIALVTVSLLGGFLQYWSVARPFSTIMSALGGMLAVLVNAAWKRLPTFLARLAVLLSLTAFVTGLFVGVVTPWFVWTIVLIFIARAQHPPVEHSQERVGALRGALAMAALLIFVVSFMPMPITMSGS